MCMEDVQLAREASSQAKVVPVGIGVTQRIVEADDNRLSITFASDGITEVWVTPEEIPSVTGQGFPLTPENPVQRFTIYDHGLVVTRPWAAFGGAAIVPLSVITMSLGKR